MYTGKNHTFVICAYKENPHLEKAIESVKKQTVKSQILLATSTPNEYLEGICKKHNLKMFVNPHPVSIGGDWNYAYSRAKTELVTIVHQDDLYEPEYLENILHYINKRKQDDVLIAYTEYYELKHDKKVRTNKLLKMKRLMNFPMRCPAFYGSIFVRRRILSFGCPICCPSVTFVKKNAGREVFDMELKNSCDYRAWSKLSKKIGSFVYVPKQLMAHRIYAESTTTQNLNENIRKKEYLEIMCGFWPRPIAKIINKIYAGSEKAMKYR